MSEISHESSNKKKGLGRGLGSLLGGQAQPSTQEKAIKVNTQPEATLSPKVPVEQSAVVVQSQASQSVSQEVQSNTVIQKDKPASATPVDIENKIWKVGIDKLTPGQFQPRRTFEKESLQELAQSIKENGILQPIIARRTKSGKLEIIAGERRWRASQIAGLHEVPVILRVFNDKEALELAIVENIQREDLNAIEEAEGYSRLITEFKLSQQQVAEKVGRDRATVANAVRLLLLPPQVKEMISKDEISVGHAKVLLSLQEPSKQIEVAKKVLKEKIAVRKLEKLVQSILKGSSIEDEVKPSTNKVSQILISGVESELQKLLGTKVNIDYSDAKGKISIYFYSDDEFNNLSDRLKQGWK